jgi:hypothetical protein
MKSPRWYSRLRQSEDGTAVIEAAVVVPVLIIIMVGLADFGRAYATLSAAQKSLRGATRYLATLPPAAVCDWGLTKARNLAVYGRTDPPTGSVPLVAGWSVGSITLRLPPGASPPDCSGTSLGRIELSAQVPYSALIWQVAGLPDTLTMTTSHEERWIGE